MPARARGPVALLAVLMVLACIVAVVAVALYLSGSYLAPGSTGYQTP